MLREEELAGAILVVLANKQDMEGCMSVAEVHQALGLEALKNRTFQVSRGEFALECHHNIPFSPPPDIQNISEERRRTGFGNGLAIECPADANVVRPREDDYKSKYFKGTIQFVFITELWTARFVENPL